MPRKKSKGDGVSTSKRKRMVHEKMDSYDPDEFIEISVGESISPHQYSRSTDERKADRRMLAQRLEDMILKRALQDNRAIEELGPAVTAGSRARPLREIHAEDNKVEKEVRKILALMPLNTSAALGRYTFNWSDLDDMASPTSKTLQNWCMFIL